MRKVKGVFRNEKWANKILFAVVVAVLVVLVGSWTSFAALMDVVNTVNSGYTSGYGYLTTGPKMTGYHTYTNNPIKDSVGLRPNGTLIKTATAPNVYWIDEGMKRWVRSPLTFNSWGFNWGSIITVSSTELASYETGIDLQPAPGTLVQKFHDQKVYIFGFDDKFHWINSATVFNLLGLNWSNIATVNYFEFALYDSTGTDISDSSFFADASLLKGSGPAVYLWEGTTGTASTYVVEWIRTPTAFNSWGFLWSNIITISDAEMSYYVANKLGSDIKAKPGTLIQGSGPAVYVVDNLAIQETTPQISNSLPTNYQWLRRWVSSETVFNNKGFLWSDIKPETDAEIAAYGPGKDVM